MADDIIFRIGADTSDLDAAMDKAKFRMAEPGTPGSPFGAPLPGGLGGTPPPKGPPPGSGKYWWQEGGSGDPERVKKFSQEVTGATNEMRNFDEVSKRAGINFGAMIERLVTRLIVFRLIAEAINGIKQAMTEASENERLQIRFENLSSSAKTAGTDFDNLSKKARAIGVAPAEWIKMDEALIKVGESAHDAAIDTETLGEYAKESGESADALASSFERVKLGTGTIDDMRTLVSVMGEAGNALRNELSLLQQEEIQLRVNNEHLQFKTMLQEHAYEGQQREVQAVTEFSDKLGIAKEVFEDMQQYRSISLMERGGVNVSAQAEFMEKRLDAGEQQIEQEENLTFAELRRLEAAGLINEKDLLAAAQRKSEAEHRAQQQKQEEDQARKRLELEEKTVTLNKEVLAAVQSRQGLESRIAAEENTQAAAAERSAQAFSQMADDSKTIHGALAAWNTAMGNIAHNFQKVSEFADHTLETLQKMGLFKEPTHELPEHVRQGPITPGEWLFGHPSEERWKAIESWGQSAEGKAAAERSHQINEQILQALNQGLLGQ